MKIVVSICDKCGDVINTQKMNYRHELEEKLTGVGYQEWCADCCDRLNRFISK